ncbi:ornithine carbamoyltransferase [Acidovorax sp. Leaf78]|uniref:ornithine carbamoyltransferase n=1 Tax=Acidovorax sp. Leaf78 TaxID=1736237 RepID=UPI0006FED9E8|nr:ornithine carbamoyltransferase [Acidovorax sp. Leaf78]KQO19759.1 ornithine carbamoyltransferase [Acidovorax sp. Leaf78]
MNLLQLTDLQPDDIRRIWALAGEAPGPALNPAPGGTVAWSFEGNGIRTRTTFIEAFRQLGLAFTELPNLLKTAERPEDLAGYLDPFYALYVVRESDHPRLSAFAAASRRPVINAMSAQGHPCEVLTDAYYVDTRIKPLQDARVCLWGPSTNVFRSWHELAQVLGFALVQVCDRRFHEVLPQVEFVEPSALPQAVDVVITDSWPASAEADATTQTDLTPLSEDHLAAMGSPALLPTPPFTLGRELTVDPAAYPCFVGYAQKELLLPVQIAIVRWVLAAAAEADAKRVAHQGDGHADR